MNERIRELAKQASTFAFTEYPKQTMATFNTNKSVEQLFNQKFAELIVRECVQSIERTIETSCEFDSEKMGCEFAITDLKKHFGVEE
jgi:hypothetical protein